MSPNFLKQFKTLIMDNNIIELSDFKDMANVYYQQLTKAAPIKGLGSHEHIYFTYGIEWAFNHLPQSKNEYDKLKEQNNSLLEALKELMRFKNLFTHVAPELQYPDNFIKAVNNAEEIILKVEQEK